MTNIIKVHTIDKYFNVITQSSKIILEFFTVLFCLIVIFLHLAGKENSENFNNARSFAAAEI